MENPSRILIGPDNLAAEVSHADEAVTCLAGRQLHAMDRMNAAGARDAEQFGY
jgi:hypothetical protein